MSPAPLPTCAAIVCAALACAGGGFAQTRSAPDTRSMAATCAACHGTDGNAIAGGAIPRIAGLRKDYFVQQMRSFREGTRPATVMRQIATGFDDEQTDALADYFARQ